MRSGRPLVLVLVSTLGATSAVGAAACARSYRVEGGEALRGGLGAYRSASVRTMASSGSEATPQELAALSAEIEGRLRDAAIVREVRGADRPAELLVVVTVVEAASHHRVSLNSGSGARARIEVDLVDTTRGGSVGRFSVSATSAESSASVFEKNYAPEPAVLTDVFVALRNTANGVVAELARHR